MGSLERVVTRARHWSQTVQTDMLQDPERARLDHCRSPLARHLSRMMDGAEALGISQSYLGEVLDAGKMLDSGGRLWKSVFVTLWCQETVGLCGVLPLEGSLRRSSALPPMPAFLRMPPLALGELPWACV